MTKTHKGAPRVYWCPNVLDKKGSPSTEKMKMKDVSICNRYMKLLTQGEEVPECPHGEWKKTRNVLVAERSMQAEELKQFEMGGLRMWTDIGSRKCKCQMCKGTIEKGERRVAIDQAQSGIQLGNGGVIARTRKYVHATCFADMLTGGTVGEGCPGCTAKMLHEEFMSVKKILKGQYAEG